MELAVANPKATDAQVNAPLIPKKRLDKNTETTIRFNGMPNIFMITDL